MHAGAAPYPERGTGLTGAALWPRFCYMLSMGWPRRNGWTALFGALCLAACEAGSQPTLARGMLIAGEADFTRRDDWQTDTDIAAHARAFLFAQVDLYLSGANPAEDGPMADMLAMLGREDLIRRISEGRGEAPFCMKAWVDPLDYLLRAAQEAQVVILVESSSQPRHRAFFSDAVEGLAGLGFGVYATDALSDGPGRTAHPGIPLITEGILARDPIYGRMLRRVKALDLQIVDGDGWWTTPSDLARLPPAELAERRLTAQSDRLAADVFSQSPEARVILHISRDPGLAALKTLEASLEALIGTAPLTVSMTDCFPSAGSRAILPDLADDAVPGVAAHLSIGDPIAAFVGGRPSWRRSIGDRDVAIPEAFRGHGEPVILEVRREGETPLAVPEDRVLLLPGDDLPLLLPPGRYRIEGWTRAGALAGPVVVVVS